MCAAILGGDDGDFLSRFDVSEGGEVDGIRASCSLSNGEFSKLAAGVQ